MKTNLSSKAKVCKFLFLSVLFFGLNVAQAQRKVESITKKVNQLTEKDGKELRSLVYDLQPSASVTKAEGARMSRMAVPQRIGPAPRVAFVDAENLGLIDQLLTSKNSIQLLQIKVASERELVKVTDLTVLADAPHLKFILFIFEYTPCQGGNLDDCVSRSLSTIKGLDQFKAEVLYEISIPR